MELYRLWFHTVPATTDALRDEAYRLRYQVYCIENAFEDPSKKQDGLDIDEFDHRSVQSLLKHRKTGATAGTVRLILPSQIAPRQSFPIQRICRDPLITDPRRFPVANMGEVSRFCVSKDFRRRLADSQFPDTLDEQPSPDTRRIIPHITLGLIEGLVQMSADHGITHWCAIMDRTLLRLLTRLGIHFDPIGPLVEYHGPRQPCYRRLTTLLEQTRQEREDVWDVITREGAHVEKLHELEALSYA